MTMLNHTPAHVVHAHAQRHMQAAGRQASEFSAEEAQLLQQTYAWFQQQKQQ